MRVQRWIAALQDLDVLLSLYAPGAVLLPTISRHVCATAEARRRYFAAFLDKRPACELLELHTVGNVQCGTYRFSFGNGDPAVDARFTFVWCDTEEGRIVHHHSSVVPP